MVEVVVVRKGCQNVKHTWKGIIPWTSRGLQLTRWKAVCQKNALWFLAGSTVNMRQLTMRLCCGKESQCHLELH